MARNPLRILAALGDTRNVLRGGGPARVKVVRVGNPEGLIVPTTEVEIEVKKRDGTVTRLRPRIPLPFTWSWAYRIAKQMPLPLITGLDPERINFELRVPGRG